MTLLETRKLVKTYSGRTVVNEVSISVEQRCIVGLLGRNGAGKTTTFRMVVGMIVPDGGTVVFEGTDITRLPMFRRARLGMGYLSQEPSVFQRLTVRENLHAILETMSITRKERSERADSLIERFGLTEVVSQPGEVSLRRRTPQARDRPRDGHQPLADPPGRALQRRRSHRRRGTAAGNPPPRRPRA